MSVRAVASAHNFDASAPSPAFASPVSRCNVNPPTTTSVFALTLDEPGAVDTITTVHDPEPPAVTHELGPTKLPAPVKTKVIVVPFGAFTKPPLPVFTFTCPVNVWFFPTGLIADNGEI